ncbi:sensor histidine kinase [Streptomyces tardus]|uniref:sensor histidine kinase n=1 Tax=Streptomyces tardus TaxID=2780544 RepID=UPI0027E4DA13|nr:HAMP domain-containing sensor histidine kinase [Streptomyces tardus]
MRLRPSRTALRVGLRWKVSTAIAAVSALVALLLSLIIYNATQVSMLSSSRDVQDERLQSALRIYESTERVALGSALNDPDLPGPLRRAVLRGERATYVSNGNSEVPDVWAATPLPDGGILSLHSRFTDRYSVLDDLTRTLILGSLSVVAGSTALGVLIGSRLSRRLRRAATAAVRVAEGDSDARVREYIGERPRDEIAELARAVDEMADALQARLEAERRVTADIAHELRTPVTGLLTAAQLLPAGRPAELVRDRAEVLRTLVEDVLEVARLDGAAERAELQEIALGEFVTRRVRALAPDAEVRVEQDAHVTTDPRRLERILGNLIANAVRHGFPPLRIEVAERVLRVRDHGPGFPEELLAEGPSRFRTGTSDRAGQGHGLGLTIAAGQARVLGARLVFRNLTPGALATLRLPATPHGSAPHGSAALPDVQAPPQHP